MMRDNNKSTTMLHRIRHSIESSIASRASSDSAAGAGGGRGRSSLEDNWDEVGNQDACAMATDNGSGEDWGY